ncbi:hypothetical protein [Peribacillus butanolivorans]
MSMSVQELIYRLEALNKSDAKVLIDKKDFDTIMVEKDYINIKSKER